jgi:hypothetical protein
MGKRLVGSVGLAPGSDEGTDLTTKGDLHGYGTSNTRVPIGSNDQVLTADSAQALGLKWATAAGGGSLELIESHTFDGSETDHKFTTDMDFNDDYSDMIVVFHGLTASSTTMSLRTNGRTINYYSTSRKNGTQTDTSNAVEAFVMDGMGGTYQNICVIHCSTATKPGGTFMGANDVGQNVITGGFGNTNSNTDAGILTEFELRFDNAPVDTAQAQQYGVKKT